MFFFPWLRPLRWFSYSRPLAWTTWWLRRRRVSVAARWRQSWKWPDLLEKQRSPRHLGGPGGFSVIFGDFAEGKRGEDFGDSNVWQYVEYVTWGNLSCEPWLMTPEGAGYLFFADIFGVRRGMMKFMLFFGKNTELFWFLVFLIWKRNIWFIWMIFKTRRFLIYRKKGDNREKLQQFYDHCETMEVMEIIRLYYSYYMSFSWRTMGRGQCKKTHVFFDYEHTWINGWMDKRWSTDNGHLKWDSKKYGIATIRLLVKFIGIYWDIWDILGYIGMYWHYITDSYGVMG